MTRHHLETQRALIAKRFWAKESMATSDNRLAILRGLSSLGQNGRSVLSDLVLSEKFVCDDPEVLEAVQKTGQALGEEDLICPGQLRFKRFKGLDRKKADAARQQTLNARLECLKLIRSRLSKSKTR